jgi:hypothetical protein
VEARLAGLVVGDNGRGDAEPLREVDVGEAAVAAQASTQGGGSQRSVCGTAILE